MAMIETKYSVGDIVWYASCTKTKKKHPCPDCKGSKKWKAISAAGREYEFPCPRCSASYHSRTEHTSLDYMYFSPSVRSLTIGSVQINTADENVVSYMCKETGVGSGTVYDEKSLFQTEAEAVAAAEEMASSKNADDQSIAKLYDKTFEVSRLDLTNAALKSITERSVRYKSDLRELFNDLDAAETMSDMRKIIDRFEFRD